MLRSRAGLNYDPVPDSKLNWNCVWDKIPQVNSAFKNEGKKTEHSFCLMVSKVQANDLSEFVVGEMGCLSRGY